MSETLPIARALAALQDPQMRLRRLARWLQEGDPDEVVQTLEAAAQCHVARETGHPRADASARRLGDRALYLAFLQLVLLVRPRPTLPGGPLPLPEREFLLGDLRLARLLGAATRGEQRFVHRLLRDAFVPPLRTEGELLMLHPSVEAISLGARRERARLPNRELWQPLLLDTTPSVVHLLGANPRLTEAQALHIATLRPTHPYALQALLMSFRWLGNEKIAEAVARNPAAPGWLVLGLAPLVPRRIQLALVHLQWIDAAVRELLARWLGVPAPAQVEAWSEPAVYTVDEAELAAESEPGPGPTPGPKPGPEPEPEPEPGPEPGPEPDPEPEPEPGPEPEPVREPGPAPEPIADPDPARDPAAPA